MPSRSWLTPSPAAARDRAVEPDAAIGDAEAEGVGPDGARPVPFGEFGAALVGEVVTPEFVRRRLNAALRELTRSAVLPSALTARIRSARVRRVGLLSDDGRQRCFAVAVGLEMEADLGPRVLALGADVEVDVHLTARFRAFRPAVVGLDIDPITPDDVRLRVRTRTGWLPFPLGDGGRFGFGRSADRAVPRLCELVNRQLDAAVERRRIDLLALRPVVVGPGGVPADRAVAGPAIGFAELGEVLLGCGVDEALVAAAVAARIDRPFPIGLDGPSPVAGVVTPRLDDVTALPDEPGERRFRLAVLADAELRVGAPGRRVAGTLRAELVLRVSTSLTPATLHVRFEPVTRLRVVRLRHELGGRMLAVPWPDQLLRSVRHRLRIEVDRRLREQSMRVVAAETIDAALGDPV